MRLTALILTANALSPLPLLAQEAFELDTIVVTANLEETEASRTGASDRPNRAARIRTCAAASSPET